MLFVPVAEGATILAAALLVGQQVLGDGCYTVYEINQVSLRQSITPGRLLGRVNAGMKLSGQAAMLIGALAGGLLGETVGLRGTLVIAANGVLLAALWLLISPVRTLRETLPEIAPLPVPETRPAV